jgi:hypothetical protein
VDRTRERSSWRRMRSRCLSPKDKDFGHYGGRGIFIDPTWSSVESFLTDMGPCPVGWTLDRVDVNGPYSKENCRWASWKTQQNNKRTNVRIEWNGECRTMAEWADHVGISRGTLWLRLHKFSIEKALTPGVMKTGFANGRKFPNRKRPEPGLRRISR